MTATNIFATGALEAWVLTGCAALLALLLTWLLVLLLLVRVRPRLLGYLAPAWLVAALMLSTPAQAASDSGIGRLDGLALPDRPITGAAPSPVGAETYTVAPGDSLWSIVSNRLDEGATASQIAAEAQKWAEANAAVIGTNPNYILAGQVLHAPREGA